MRGKTALVNIVSSVILQIINIICGFLVPKLLIKTYGSNVNGLVVSITQFLSFIILLEAGFGPVIKSVLFKPIAKKDKAEICNILKESERAFKKIAYIFVFYIILLCFILPKKFSNEFDGIFTLSLIFIISISIFAEYYLGMTYKLYIQAEQKTYVINIIQLVTLLLNTASILVFVYFGVSIQIVKLASSIIFVLRPILQSIYVKKKYNISLKNIEKGYKIKQKYEGLVQHITYVIHRNVDIVILTMFGDFEEISVYTIYLLIINSIKNIVQSFADGIDTSFGDMIARGEDEILTKNFKIYEEFFFTIATILFTSLLFLIIPFIKIYMNGVNDANYIRPIFSSIMVLAEFMCIIRIPYEYLVKAGGHFKNTQKGACIEAICNIVVSCILVKKFGIVGVAIGTLVAMSIRTIDFMYYTSKFILKRNFLYTFKRLIIIAIELLMLSIIFYFIPKIIITNYFEWIIQGIIVFAISSITVLGINYFIYKDNFEGLFKKFNVIIKR